MKNKIKNIVRVSMVASLFIATVAFATGPTIKFKNTDTTTPSVNRIVEIDSSTVVTKNITVAQLQKQIDSYDKAIAALQAKRQARADLLASIKSQLNIQ